MNHKKLLIFSLISLMSLLVLVGCGKKATLTQQPGKLTIGMEGTYAPFGYRNKAGKLTGFDVEVSKAIAKKMNLKPEYKLTGWDSLLAGINSNSYDVVFNNLAVNNERKTKYRMATPYVYSKTILITKKGSSIKSINDVKNKTLGEGTGTDNWKVAQRYGAKIIAAPEFNSAMQMIHQGRTDGSINAEPAFEDWQKQHPNSDLTYYKIPGTKAEAIAPMMNKKSKALNQEMNQSIHALQKDGTLKRLSLKYFGKDITQR